MSSLQIVEYGNYHINFRFNGKRYKRSLNTRSEPQALVRKEAIDETLALLCKSRLEIPQGVAPATFILADGKVPKLDPANTKSKIQDGKPTPPTSVSFQDFFTQFFDSIPDDNLERETVSSMHTHEAHLLRILKPSFHIAEITLQDLQRYVNTRAEEYTQFLVDKSSKSKKPIRTKVSVATIKKELVTLGTAWKWASSVPLVTGSLPRKALRFPKTQEKPPFQTWHEIERQIEQDGLTGREAKLLWDALYLRRSEIDDLLNHVKQAALYPFIHPMFVMAAHTGARRSELLRSRKSDFDFTRNIVTIHEKKRVRGTLTTRRVTLSPTLRTVILDWFDNQHPGVPHTFCHTRSVARSRTRATARSAITSDSCHDHFQRTLSDSKWENIRGWHCLRHSFISNLACSGIDQRIIDEFVGHTTDEMRRRYRHLFPDVKQAAIDQVFG